MAYLPRNMAHARSYARVGLETSVGAASPHQLIVLLFDGASTAISQAKLHLERGAIADRGMATSKAINIVQNGLQTSLNMEEGGEIAANLHSLYDFIIRTLLTANLRADVKEYDTAARLLNDLREAWAAIAPNSSVSSASVSLTG